MREKGRLLPLFLTAVLLTGCRASAGASPRPAETNASTESSIPPEAGLTPAPEPDWEELLAGLRPENIKSILRDISDTSISPETLVPLVREAMGHAVEHRAKENGDDQIWSLGFTLTSDWQDGDITLWAGLEENLVGLSLPGKLLWLEDGDLYQLVRTSMDTPRDIDQAAYEKYGDFIRVHYDGDMARRNQRAEEGLPGDPGWTAAGWELDVLRLAAEREDLGVQVYDLRIVNFVDPPELALHRIAGGAYVDSRLAIHGWDWKYTYLAVADGEPAGVFFLPEELDMDRFATRQEFLDMVAEETTAGG